jgi:hypothetical protein
MAGRSSIRMKWTTIPNRIDLGLREQHGWPIGIGRPTTFQHAASGSRTNGLGGNLTQTRSIFIRVRAAFDIIGHPAGLLTMPANPAGWPDG